MKQMMNPSIARDSLAPEPGQATTAQHKILLRDALLARRNALSSQDKAHADARLVQRLLDWCAAHAITSLGVYQPIRREPDLLAAYNALVALGVHLSLPVVVERDAALEFRVWKPGDVLEKEPLGTLVPPAGTAVVQPQALLVPCVGFNERGYRLGYGGGYYDRTLAATPRPLAVGVCYGFGRVQFEGQPHDVPLDQVLTDVD